jgi:hypothetical protein
MITRCEARITAQLELLATLSRWEPKSQTVRQEVEVEEGVLQSLQHQRVQMLAQLKGRRCPDIRIDAQASFAAVARCRRVRLVVRMILFQIKLLGRPGRSLLHPSAKRSP